MENLIKTKTIQVATTYLQMTECPEFEVTKKKMVNAVRLFQPYLDYYKFLYQAVGKDLNWIDRLLMKDDELSKYINSPKTEIYVFHVHGAPIGFCELDKKVKDEIEIVYFGLVPQFRGKGYGKYLLRRILMKAWSYKPDRVWLHTCELDHPIALQTYYKVGFEKYDQKMIEQRVPEDFVF